MPCLARNRKLQGVKTFFKILPSTKILSLPGPIFLMIIRICMALAFHIFHIIWVPSLKKRFDFGPKDHGMFMSFIGLSYALSQGLIAKKIITLAPGAKNRPKILMVSALLLGLGRVFAFLSNDLRTVYCVFGLMIVSLGVVNTILSADASGLVPASEMGSLFGILEAVESGAGIIGPILGGSLSLISPVWAPLSIVFVMYAIVFAMVFVGYEKFVLSGKITEESKKI